MTHRTVRRAALLFALTALTLLGALVALGEFSGEVVVLHTRDKLGRVHRTRLWIVDFNDTAWLRAGGRATGSASSWYARLIAEPEVGLDRGGRRLRYHAVAVPELRSTINDQMRASYPLADWTVRSIRGLSVASNEDTSMPIRLDQAGDPTERD